MLECHHLRTSAHPTWFSPALWWVAMPREAQKVVHSKSSLLSCGPILMEQALPADPSSPFFAYIHKVAEDRAFQESISKHPSLWQQQDLVFTLPYHRHQLLGAFLGFLLLNF